MISAISLLLRKRGTRIRGHVLTKIRQCLVIFGFENKANPATKMKNEMLYQKLKKDSCFHYKDIEARKGFAEGKIVSDCLKATWFEDKDSQGVVFSTLFNPVPAETIAAILTVIDFCLDEWSTGVQVKATMWEKDVIARHKVFREDVNKWCATNKNVTTSIRTKIRDAGAVDDAVVVSTLDKDMLEQMKDELEGRTGETDSEAEE
ncbi:hypothetical protein CVT26_004625 [Gymnopilus dilepis]|uniref:DUF6532 domain-containing protein n=1 Tax=Gymnopilus dilepis TaxID=231916 RepID=A0A409YTK9_9AGAR|nr:hypothetical protein CVT26_004625 [Gymnopilus dilepis]